MSLPADLKRENDGLDAQKMFDRWSDFTSRFSYMEVESVFAGCALFFLGVSVLLLILLFQIIQAVSFYHLIDEVRIL